MGEVMRRIELSLAGVQVKFTDRDLALRQVEDWANKGTYPVQVVYGPEGCGKTSWLRQSTELLRELGFEVIYVNPVEREFVIEVGVEDVRRRFLEILREATDESWARAVWALIDLARELIRVGRGKLAVLVDDAFRAIGIDRAAIYVKGLLGLIEYPPEPYERIIAVATTSEGLSKREIGRHRWATLLTIWNMTKEGFKQLYEQLPGPKPGFEEVWRLTGGNPWMLSILLKNRWSVDDAITELVRNKGLGEAIQSLSKGDRELLARAVEDPDVLMSSEGIPLMNKLIELNLIVNSIYPRARNLWIDEPPPEKDPELGIGRFVAWQSPLHREAVKRALEWVR